MPLPREIVLCENYMTLFEFNLPLFIPLVSYYMLYLAYAIAGNLIKYIFTYLLIYLTLPN